MEVVKLIGDQRGDGALIKDEKEALGYDREAYEHSLQLPKVFKVQSASIPLPGGEGEMILLFRLGAC
jgi:hypothetical protein